MKKEIRFVARALKSRYIRDSGEIACLRKSLHPGDIAIDIGANKGQYTYWMLKSVGISGKVIAFEPQPELANYLSEISKLMNFKQLKIEQLGLSSESAIKTLVIPQVGKEQSPLATLESLPQDGFLSYKIKVDTLDNYIKNKPSLRPVRFIKCDVEGHEFEVLKGGIELIKKDKPDILFECEIRHIKNHSIFDVFEFLYNLGYQGSFILGNQILPLSTFEPSVHHIFGQKPYANNFIFRTTQSVQQI